MARLGSAHPLTVQPRPWALRLSSVHVPEQRPFVKEGLLSQYKTFFNENDLKQWPEDSFASKSKTFYGDGI